MSESDTSSILDNNAVLKIIVDKMRERLMKTRVDSAMFEGIREINLYHGLKLTSSTPLIGTFAEICYCSETQEYLVLDTGIMVHRYSMQGKPIRPPYQLSSTMLFTRMIWCPDAKVSACFIPRDDLIWIVNSACKLLQIVRNEFRIEEILYSSMSNKMIVVGTNKVTIYPMHDTEHPLNSVETLNYLDSSYGPLWRIEYSSLIDHSSILYLVGSYLTTMYILPLQINKETAGPIEFIAKRLSATKAAITALYYHRTSEWIITGDQQGNVSGWNFKLECIMSCPNAHNGQIRLIIRHPSICGFLTCSDDNVLQVWSCNLRDKMESFHELGEVWCIAVNEAATAIATLGSKLNCFQMNQLYVFYAPLTAPATNLYSTTNPLFPTRIIVTSSDNTVTILSSRKGKQINVQLLSPKLEIVAAAYSGITSTSFTIRSLQNLRYRMYTIILKTGEILVSSVKMKPMKLKHVWVNDEYTITCIVAYETFEKIIPTNEEEKVTINPVSTLIIVGTLDGNLVIIGETSGKHECVVSAHEDSIVDLCSSTRSHQVVSLGKDKCVKVWRIFPDIKLPLILMNSIYYIVPITRVASLRSTICIVSSTEHSAKHQIFMYDTAGRIRLDHHPSKNHSAFIMSIATLESLEICATSSADKTIRIWNGQNELLKILTINTSSPAVIFSSLLGDIVFSAGKHLYRIPYENYCWEMLDLSPNYRARLIVEDIQDESDDEFIPENVNYRIYENEVDREKVLHPVSSTPFGSLDTESSDAPKLELMMLEQMVQSLRYRDEDVLRIKNSEIKGSRLVGDKSIMSNEAWEKHIAHLLQSSKITGKDVAPAQDIWSNVGKFADVKKAYNEPGVFRMIHGYSISSLDDYSEDLRATVKSPKLPLFGFLPNSGIYKAREEPTKKRSEARVEKLKFKYEYPSEILLGELLKDSQDDLDIPITLSQLANLGGDDEMIEE